jgi:hypothetical protein
MDWGGKSDRDEKIEAPDWVAYFVTAWMIAAAYGLFRLGWTLFGMFGQTP